MSIEQDFFDPPGFPAAATRVTRKIRRKPLSQFQKGGLLGMRGLRKYWKAKEGVRHA